MAFAIAMLAGAPAVADAARFNYTYLEVTGDLSKTRNTAAAPVEDDADGKLFGIAGAWEVVGGFYLKGAWSKETKDFSNAVVGTPLDLDSEQRTTALGAGYHVEAGERTSVHAEFLYLVDFEVEHSIPLVVPARFGPPTVTTAESVIEGDGVSVSVGVRRFVGERLELDGQIARIWTSADVARTGDSISDSETVLKVGARWHVGNGLSMGAFGSYSKHTDDNFNNIRKIGVSLRYEF